MVYIYILLNSCKLKKFIFISKIFSFIFGMIFLLGPTVRRTQRHGLGPGPSPSFENKAEKVGGSLVITIESKQYEALYQLFRLVTTCHTLDQSQLTKFFMNFKNSNINKLGQLNLERYLIFGHKRSHSLFLSQIFYPRVFYFEKLYLAHFFILKSALKLKFEK